MALFGMFETKKEKEAKRRQEIERKIKKYMDKVQNILDVYASEGAMRLLGELEEEATNFFKSEYGMELPQELKREINKAQGKAYERGQTSTGMHPTDVAQRKSVDQKFEDIEYYKRTGKVPEGKFIVKGF